MGSAVSSLPHAHGHKVHVNASVPTDLPIWRRDGRDIKIMKNVIEKEIQRVTSTFPDIEEEEVKNYMKIYSHGVWEAYRGMVDLIIDEKTPYNERLDADPDHWFEIDLANSLLFANLTLKGIEELLPGRLFTTRMPRDLNNNPENAANFKKKVEKNHLHSVLILTERKEYEKYAGSDLESFYHSIGLNVICRPIKDFTVPNPDDLIADIKDVTWLLSEGHNVLVHCAGGSGRTGMVIAGIVRNVGVRDPIAWIRQVKSIYVETQAQEEFINNLPVVIDERIASKHPKLLEAFVLEQLLDMSSPGMALDSQQLVTITDQHMHDIDIAFDRLDIHHQGYLPIEDMKRMVTSLGGASVNVDIALAKIDHEKDEHISKEEFVKMMCYTMKSSIRHYPDAHH